MEIIKIIGIYKITNPQGKVYIGKSIDVVKRIKCYTRNFCKKQYLLHNSLVEFGFWNHKVEIIKECQIIELDKLESFYILKYKNKSLNIKLIKHDSVFLSRQYNISIGKQLKKTEYDYTDDKPIPCLNPG